MNPYRRRDFLKTGIGATVTLSATGTILSLLETKAVGAEALLLLDATVPQSPVLKDYLHLGTARNPKGQTIAADSRSLLRDGKPWLPVMGEFHYARYPETEWKEELLKMRAGGIDVAASYVFWIHHEEIEGTWDWSGRRSLRGFAQRCSEAGLLLVVRCGPWCHGEVRNGGFPDWLLKKGVKTRSDDPAYLNHVQRFYQQIAEQLKGLLWKDGGPVIGIQVENEFGGPGEHLLTLKRMAREAGLDVPVYTRTGWPALKSPVLPGELLPLFGSYAEGFWDRELTPMLGKYGDAFRFILARGATTAAIGTDQLGAHRSGEGDEVGQYPYFCCEIGGGMMPSYHRRIDIAPEDIESAALVKIGSGNNLQGYYMYHGGTNPEGKSTTLQESQATGYWNDLPVKSYDFQAPLGEFGQVSGHYHLLRRMHLFLRDWGSLLATLPAQMPEQKPANAHDTTTLRWAARTDGDSGFIFVNNYQRLQPMPHNTGVQFQLRLREGELRVPAEPFTVPADSLFFWPFHLSLSAVKLIYATAQPICQVTDQEATYVVFTQTAGVPTEFVFDSNGVRVEGAAGKVSTADGRIRVQQVRPGTGAAIRLRTTDGKRLHIVLLDEKQSLACWKDTLAGHERLFLTRAGLVRDGEQLRLTADDPADLSVAVLPAPESLLRSERKVQGTADGLFRRFTMPKPPATPVKVTWEPVQAAGPAREIHKGSQGVAEAPTDEDFVGAAVWRIRLPESVDSGRDLLLRVRYVGDVARFYLDGKLLTDNFYNGNAFELGLKRYAPDIYRKELLLKVLPLSKDAPLYLARDAWPDFGGAESAVRVAGMDVIERHQMVLQL